MPFGMMGGLGGNGYVSPGASVLSGMEAGANFIWQAQDREQRRQQVQYEREREDRLDAMKQAQDDLHTKYVNDEITANHIKTARTILEDQRTQMANASDAWARTQVDPQTGQPRYPNGVSDIKDAAGQAAIQAQFGSQMYDWNQKYKAVAQAGMGPFMQDQQDQAIAWSNRLQNGTATKDDTSPQTTYHNTLVLTGNDPTSYLRGADGKSVMGRAGDNIQQGMQDTTAPGAHDAVSVGSQQMFGNQLDTNVGQLSGHAATTTQTVLDPTKSFVPTPANPAAVFPVVRHTGTDDNDVDHTHPAQPVIGPDGQPVALKMDDFFNHVQGHVALEKAINASPGMAQAIATGAQKPDDKTLDFAAMMGIVGMPSKSSKATVHPYTVTGEDGQSHLHFMTVDEAGRTIADKDLGVDPRTTVNPKASKFQQQLDALDADRDNAEAAGNPMSPAEYKRRRVLIESGDARNAMYGLNGAPAGGAGGKVKEASEPEIKAAQAAAVKEAEVHAGIGHRKVTSTDADGNNVIQDQPYHKSTGIALTGDEQVAQDEANLAAEKAVVEQARPAGIAPHAAGAGAKPAPKLGAPPAAPAAGQPPPPSGYKPL
jgi:hypothetical protein